MASTVANPAVAASAVASLVDGVERAASVLSARPEAIVLQVDAAAGHRLVCLLADDLTRLPNGVHADLAGVVDPPPRGAQATVGASRIGVGGRVFTVVRRWDSRIGRIDVSDIGLAVIAGALCNAEFGVPLAARDRLARWLAGSSDDPVRSLVGLGRGLTPGGDDLLAGAAVGLHAAGRPDLACRLAAALPTDLDVRTTALSADLLRLALAGHACAEVGQVLRTLHGTARDPAHRPGLVATTTRLLAVGHTSGADLAAGLLIGLEPAARVARHSS
ncbi:MAG TPA: DUF2877 domain-containing protein [Nakamurella sp.]